MATQSEKNFSQQEVTHGIYTDPLKVYTWNLSDSYLYQSVSLHLHCWKCPSSRTVPSSSSHSLQTFLSPWLSFCNVLSVSSIASDVHHYLKPTQSLLGRCAVLPWRSTDKHALDFLILLAGVKIWSPVKSHSLYYCFRWFLKGMFATASCTCSSEVIPAGICSWNYQFFVSAVKCLLNDPTASYPVFYEHPWPSVPHHCRPILHQFIGIFNLSVDIWRWFLEVFAP